MTTGSNHKRRESGAGCAVAALLILFTFYVIIDSHYDQIDTREIRDLKVRIEALEQKVKQP